MDYSFVLTEAIQMLIAVAGVCGVPGYIIWKYIEGRNHERMAIIEKGLAAEEIRELFKRRHRERRTPNPLPNLKWGLLIFFVGIGASAGIQLHEVYYWDEGFTFAFAFIGAGLALLVFYGVASKKAKEDRLEEERKSLQK